VFRASGVIVLALLVLAGCGKRETAAERRQREAVDLCYKGLDRIKANDEAGAESRFKQALDVDPLCDKAREALASMKGGSAAIKAARSQIDLFKTPLQMYQMTIGSYPTTMQGLEALRTAPGDLPNPAKWDGPYLNAPIPLDPWNQPYQYVSPGRHNPNGYDVWSVGPDGVNGTQDDIGNW